MSKSQTIYQIYDKIFKKLLTLSPIAVINMINGLFGTDYPPDSTITYHWTEHIDDNLRRCLADTILTINGRYSYHMEAQMTEDEDIVLRVFDYGYAHARKLQNSNSFSPSAAGYTLPFPETRIICLFSGSRIPDEYILNLDFGSQCSFTFKAPTFKYPEYTIEELNQRKLIILIPFSLLKLRDRLKKHRSPEDILALKRLIFDDIITSIDKNLAAQNITVNDAYKLKRLTHMLYQHLYSHYPEMEELNEMTDEALILDIDILEDKYEKLFEEQDAKFTRQEAALRQNEETLRQRDNEIKQRDDEIKQTEEALKQMDDAIKQKDNAIKKTEETLMQKNNAIAQQEAEIQRLLAEIERLKTAIR